MQDNPVVQMFLDTYIHNYTWFGPQGVKRLLKNCRDLPSNFTELDVTRMAVVSELFPHKERYYPDDDHNPPSLIFRPGELGIVREGESQSVEDSWTMLGTCRYIHDRVSFLESTVTLCSTSIRSVWRTLFGGTGSLGDPDRQKERSGLGEWSLVGLRHKT